ncbi:reverse transcriptase domain-containing protein [Priestia megaterium]|uniref:reverse transcriptase domain-containing protein n=1 Tax=Priestia megaterium TaxID=1404 RepID=UPI0021D65D5F|nr:reverse transcriptase domain-containing protein [Priestia megaterium]MCU7736161.1 reverse transcriptase domain-containing protein [Priestia megaterium]MCU7741325.1 reverse transcriptase domain-containing protein [Priestia megaterium]MCU7741374.1 reverse transcriptase domain-containing protein [Priestia megaterium]
MRNPNDVLSSLVSKADHTEYKYKRLYRNLYNIDFYLLAYHKINAKEGNLTKGADGKTIDGMSIERIQNIIDKLREQSYRPHPAKRVYIPKEKQGKRPLGIPSFDDKLVQEVLRLILESIYEPQFLETSHGFRPQRSCHTALIKIQRRFTGVKWFVEGDIKGFFDNIDHHTLIGILRRRIDDEKFLNLIWKFLKAGYLENWVYHKTYSGVPQGGIISPLLANIYLNELDKYAEEYKKKFDSQTSKRKSLIEYKRVQYKVSDERKWLNENWNSLSKEQQKQKLKSIREKQKTLSSMNCTDPMDENFKRLNYIRYADDWIIGIIGSKQDAEDVKKDFANYLKSELKLDLSLEKTLVTNSRKMARFLGYDVTVERSSAIKKDKNGIPKRSYNGGVKIYVPHEKWVNSLLEKGALNIRPDGQWKILHRNNLIRLDDLEILSTYNAEIRGLYNYYRIANNASVLNKFKYVMEYSLYKTFASKYRKSKGKIINKYSINGIFGVKYKVKGEEKIRYLYNEGFKRQKPLTEMETDYLPTIMQYKGRNSLISRLEAQTCEICKTEEKPFEVHHVRKIKDLKGKKRWEQKMIARRRKTLVVCLKCHRDIHNGKLD